MYQLRTYTMELLGLLIEQFVGAAMGFSRSLRQINLVEEPTIREMHRPRILPAAERAVDGHLLYLREFHQFRAGTLSGSAGR